MELFRQMGTNALKIDEILAGYGQNNSNTSRAMQDMQRGVDTLQSDTTGGSFASGKDKVNRAARIMLNKSAGLAQELSRMATRIGKNNEQTRQLSAHSRTLRTARDTITNLLLEVDNGPNQPIVMFNWLTINAGNRQEPIALKHPGGTSEKSAPPCALLEVSGLKGTHVSVDIEHVRGAAYGGHIHSVGRNQGQVGTFTVQQGVTASSTPGNNPALEFKLPWSNLAVNATYQATDFCSRFKVTINVEGFGSRSFFVDVKFGKTMENLSAIDHPYIETYTNDDTHPDSHWGRPPLVKAIRSAADAFGRQYEAGNFGETTEEQNRLWVNDLSLPWGGLIETHDNHRWGQNVDISYLKMNKAQRTWQENQLKNYFDYVGLHEDPLHWHCSVHM